MSFFIDVAFLKGDHPGSTVIQARPTVVDLIHDRLLPELSTVDSHKAHIASKLYTLHTISNLVLLPLPKLR